jgi:hypothetical protein
MTMLDRDFVCAGCQGVFSFRTPSKFVKRDASRDRERLLVFHSVECLIAWERPDATAASGIGWR